MSYLAFFMWRVVESCATPYFHKLGENENEKLSLSLHETQHQIKLILLPIVKKVCDMKYNIRYK